MPDGNKHLVRRLFDAVDRDDYDSLDDLIAADVVDHTPFPGQGPGVEGVKQLFAMLRRAFPDFRQEIHQIISEGDRVAVRSALRGTHRGNFMGIPPTGRPVDAESLDIFRVRDGKVAEHWGQLDQMALMSQLGTMPPG